MKLNIKHFSKSALSTVLALCMLFTCATAALVPTDAAKVGDEKISASMTNDESIAAEVEDESLGWTESKCYIHIKIGNAEWTDYKMSNSKIMFIVPSDNTTCTWDLVAEDTWYKKASGDSAPNSSSSSTTTYFAKKDQSDFSVTLSAGVYTIEYVTRYDDNATLAYHFWKSSSVYNVTVQSSNTNYGTVASSSVNAGSGLATTLPKATPKYGYKFTGWTTTSSNISITDSSSADAASITASETGTVTANFAFDTNTELYIAGRFHVQTSDTSGVWTNSFDNGDWSNTGDDNIKFTYVSGTKFKLDTHASLKDLSDSISGFDPYFYIYDKTNDKYWYCTTSGTELTLSKKSTTLTKYDSESGNTVNANLRFNDQSTNKPVTIYFDIKTGVISFETPTYYTISCISATGGSVESKPSTQKAGETVTLTLKPSTGYTVNNVSVKNGSNTVSVSGSGNTRTFTMPAGNVTVTPSFTETTHTVTVKRRLYSTGDSSPSYTTIQTINGVGIDTTGTVNTVEATYEDYSFESFKLSSSTNLTVASGSLSDRNSFTINAKADNLSVYADYRETLYTIATQSNNNSYGRIQKNSSNIDSTNIGNVTAVSLTAKPENGYKFVKWEITKGTATTAVVNNQSYNLGTSATVINEGTQTSIATSTFKFNGTATVKAYFEAVEYSVTAKFPDNNTYTKNDTTGNHVSVSVTNNSYTYGNTYTISVLLAPGYEVASITGSGVPTSWTSKSETGNVWTYSSTITGNVDATVTLKAKTPTLENLQVKDQSFFFANVSNGGTVDNYYRQPTVAKATTDSFSTISYVTKQGNTPIAQTQQDVVSEAEVDLDYNLNIIPATEDGYVTYTLQVTATNSKPGVTAATATMSCTVRVYFNDTQKIYFNLKNLLDRCIREDTSSNIYYNEGAPINAYNTAYDEAKKYIDSDYAYNETTGIETYNPVNSDYPDYNAGSSDETEAQGYYDNFEAMYTNMKKYAKKTTVYILANTAYSNTSNMPINLYVSSNGNSADYKHFTMFSYRSEINPSDLNNYHASYYGYVVKNNANYYIYTFTYTGRADFQVWAGTNADDSTFTPDGNATKKLTGKVTGTTAFKDNYINIYNVTATSTNNSTEISLYSDFDHDMNTARQYLVFGSTKTGSEIFEMFNFTSKGSIITDPGITTTCTAFTITGPVGKPTSKQTDLKNMDSSSFTANLQGKYNVSYTTRFGYYADGTEITKTAVGTLWVTDEVTVYVDMNDNVGNPILNFKYYTNSSGTPEYEGTSGAIEAYLPYEMELVTGSESIYKYTIKISKMRNDYKIQIQQGQPIHISYITVENVKIGANTGGFDIGTESIITGEAWLKANSTKLTSFDTISCGSVNKSFFAVYDNQGSNTMLLNAIENLSGTGIVTDLDDIYSSRYAALYTVNNATKPMYSFNYVLKAAAKKEVTVEGTTYYFDRWDMVKTNGEVVKVENGNITNNISGATVYSNSTDLNFTKADDYGTGNEDTAYIARYKVATRDDSTVRVEVTYNFKDFDTSDGNYIYQEGKTVNASYTKTIKVPVGSGLTYENFAAVNDVNVINTIVSGVNLPHVVSNYFNYSYTESSAEIKSANPAQSKIVVTANLTHTPREYKIILKNGSESTAYMGKYQQTVELPSTEVSNPVWKIQAGTNNWVTLGSGETNSTFTARFVSIAERDGTDDCQIIKVEGGSSTAAEHKSVVSNAFTEKYYSDSGDTQMLSHNFYIIDYCAEGELLGGGVLYATTENGAYRQTNAATYLGAYASPTDQASITARTNFITDILKAGTQTIDYSTEYKAQSINNVGFRYKPYKDTEDVFRYSNELNAYLTVFEGSNVNSPNYKGQKLRLFSFMVYKSGNNTVIVPSEGYAEVDRYKEG